MTIIFWYRIPAINDDEKKDEGLNAFLNESRARKQHYAQYTSFWEFANSNKSVDDLDNSLLVDNPHFMLTLGGLGAFVEGPCDEAAKVRELNDCIQNNQNNPILNTMRSKLGNVYNVDPSRIVITEAFYGTTNIGYMVRDLGQDGVVTIVKNAKDFMKKMNYEFVDLKNIMVTEVPPCVNGSYAVVKSYHVSCASRKTCSDWLCPLSSCNYGGVVLYMKDGKTDWYCNGRHCKIGYIIVKPIEDIKNVQADRGAIHGKVYNSVFKENPKNVVGSGFARRDGVWKWNSGSFNWVTDEWHDTKGKYKNQCESKTMNEVERKWIKKAVQQWHNTGKQNMKVDESLIIFKDQ